MSRFNSNTPNYYGVLDLNNNASQDQIKEAYRNLMKKYHPDNFANLRQKAQGDPDLEKLVEEKILQMEKQAKLVNEAYSTLRNPTERAAYDTFCSSNQVDGEADSTVNPPNIVLQPTTLDFGSIYPGQPKILSFIIKNTGGPVTSNIQIDLEDNVDFIDFEAVPDPNDTFPIKVNVSVAYSGNPKNNSNKIIITANGQSQECYIYFNISNLPDSGSTKTSTLASKKNRHSLLVPAVVGFSFLCFFSLIASVFLHWLTEKVDLSNNPPPTIHFVEDNIIDTCSYWWVTCYWNHYTITNNFDAINVKIKDQMSQPCASSTGDKANIYSIKIIKPKETVHIFCPYIRTETNERLSSCFTIQYIDKERQVCS